MSAFIVRRRKLGRTSCREIANQSQRGIFAWRADRRPPRALEEADLCFRWGCTVDVPVRNVVNTSAQIHLVNNKTNFRALLRNNNPEIIPPTYFLGEEVPNNVFPVVIRPEIHSQGRRIYIANNRAELVARIGQAGLNPYISKCIEKDREVRVFVVQGRVACVAEKTPSNPVEFAWNVARGGRFDVLNWDAWPLKACKYAIKAMENSGLTFGGVDVLLERGTGEPFVIEINSAPSLTSPYRQECMAKCFDYIVDNGKENIPLVERRGNYRKFIHPAVFEGALL